MKRIRGRELAAAGAPTAPRPLAILGVGTREAGPPPTLSFPSHSLPYFPTLRGPQHIPKGRARGPLPLPLLPHLAP